jgi:minor fimbrial subunit
LSYSADTVNINVTGNIVASPCIVNGGASSLNVDLGSAIQATALAAPDHHLLRYHLHYRYKLPNRHQYCRAHIGVLDPDAPNLYENSGTAGNVYVGLYQA